MSSKIITPFTSWHRRYVLNHRSSAKSRQMTAIRCQTRSTRLQQHSLRQWSVITSSKVLKLQIGICTHIPICGHLLFPAARSVHIVGSSSSKYLVVGGGGPPSNSLRTLWSLQRRVWTPVLWVLLICCNSGIGCRLRGLRQRRGDPRGRWLYPTGGGWPESEMVIYEAVDCETDTAAPLTASLRPGVVFERKVSADGLMAKGIDIHTGEIMYLNWFRWPRRV